MQAFHDITVKEQSLEGNTGTYLVAPLPKGYGHTLGNTIRRILLSSIEGSAVTQVEIDGVSHEYTALDGVKEDVMEIILNIKALRFKMLADEEDGLQCVIDVKGKKLVTGADIELPGQLEIMNPEAEIATLTASDSKLKIKMTVKKGIGYMGDVQDKREEIGVIPIDADFSPITHVAYQVQSARKGHKVDLDGVLITVSTDGSITPVDALLKSAELLQDFAGKVMVGLGVSKEDVEKSAEQSYIVEQQTDEEDVVASEIGSWRVEDLPISKRSKSGLLSGGYVTVADIAKCSKDDLMALQGFGNKSLNEVIDLMKQYGIDIA